MRFDYLKEGADLKAALTDAGIKRSLRLYRLRRHVYLYAAKH